MSKLKAIIKLLDIFPETFQFNLNGRGLKKTVSGGIISMITIISILCISIFLFFSFIDTRKPSVISGIQYLPLTKPSKVLNENLQVMIGLLNIDTFDQKPLRLNISTILQTDVDLTQKLINSSVVTQNQIGKLVNCNQNTSSKELLRDVVTKYKFVNSSSIICINLNKNPDFLIGGDTFTGKTSYVSLNFTLDLCSFEPDCLNPLKLINPRLSFGMFFFDNFFNVSEPNGYTRFPNNYFFNYIPNQNALVTLNLFKNEITTRKNLITDDEELQDFYNSNGLTTSYSPSNNPSKPNLLNIIIRVQVPISINIITRIYPKLDTFLASNNAICSIIYLVALILVKVLNYGYVDFHLMRNLYYIGQPNIFDDQIFKRKLFKEQRRHSINNVDLSFDLSNEAPQLHNDSINNYNIGIKDKNCLNLSQENFEKTKVFLEGIKVENQTWKWIINKLCFTKEENMKKPLKHFFYGKQLLLNDLNIIVILKKLFYFETVLSILFNKKQLDVMKQINQTKIYDDLNIEEMKKGFGNKNKITNEQLENFVEGLIYCSKNNTKKSKKILNKIKFF